ncbi:MAG TPA: aldo/keto reductase [Minicystis sp.]|nr:aldo/keto reductase [Minicystis sp.]
MRTPSWWDKVAFGRSGLSVSRVAIGSSYGIGGADLERAFERGVNFFFFGLRRTRHYAAGVRALAPRHRDRMVIAIQSYSRSALLVKPSVHAALRALRVDHVDVLGLGWWNDAPPARIVDAARALVDAGKVRHLLISSHHRPAFEALAKDPTYAGIMVRYSAAHPGAEREVFPHLGAADAPGVLAFTATRWGKLTEAELTPPGERTPTATDCYRFVLSSPHVHATLTGPRDAERLDEAMAALDRGPMSPEEIAWMKRVGVAVREKAKAGGPIHFIDKLSARFAGRHEPGPRQA